MTSDEPAQPAAAAAGGNSGLPGFIQRRENGVFVDRSKLTVGNAFRLFVERLFSHGARFTGLDYPRFQNLLFGVDPQETRPGPVKLAAEIVVFPGQRQALYKGVKLIDGGSSAEYMFEPAFLEITDAPTSPDEPAKVRLEPAELDFDEFVAAMWLKGVCFGMDVDAVAAAIAAGKVARITVASELLPTSAQDARLHEEWAGLHRDDSPLIRNGIADLRSHKNRFPQITRNQRMLKKIPSQPGKPGYRVTGQLVEPNPPKDIDLAQIAGPGTRVETTPEGDFVVAIGDGFLIMHPGSSQISVTEKIDDSSGISAKTTGDLFLSVDEFVERGEVQEGCSVEGKHMRFMSAVYGSVVSKAGRIELLDNLSGGSASSPGGSIKIHQRASNARIVALGGTIEIQYAENCTVIGQTVTVAHAVNCDIVADSVRITTAQGCSIAAHAINIETADARKERPTIVSVLIPDSAGFFRRKEALELELAALRTLAHAKAGEIERIESAPEYVKFLSFAAMVRSGAVKFSLAQDQSFRAVQNKHAPTTRTLEKLATEKKSLLQQVDTKRQEIDAMTREQTSVATGRRCKITTLAGETVVQQKLVDGSVDAFAALEKKDLARAVSAFSAPSMRIQPSYQGGIDWHYELTPRMVA